MRVMVCDFSERGAPYILSCYFVIPFWPAYSCYNSNGIEKDRQDHPSSLNRLRRGETGGGDWPWLGR